VARRGRGRRGGRQFTGGREQRERCWSATPTADRQKKKTAHRARWGGGLPDRTVVLVPKDGRVTTPSSWPAWKTRGAAIQNPNRLGPHLVQHLVELPGGRSHALDLRGGPSYRLLQQPTFVPRARRVVLVHSTTGCAGSPSRSMSSWLVVPGERVSSCVTSPRTLVVADACAAHVGHQRPGRLSAPRRR